MQLTPTSQRIVPAGGSRDDQPTSERANDQQYNYHYYEEYKRLHQTAHLLSLRLRQLAQTKEEMWARIGKLEVWACQPQKKTEDFKDDIRGEPAERKKRFRRTAQEIERKFVCEVERCNKCYGSEGSLQQHIKLKHPEIYESKSQHQPEHSQRDEHSKN